MLYLSTRVGLRYGHYCGRYFQTHFHSTENPIILYYLRECHDPLAQEY